MTDAGTRPAYWKPPITEENRKPHGCLNCEAAGVIAVTFPPNGVIAVGFGMAALMRDNRCVYDEPRIEDAKDEDYMTGAQAEAMAAKDPDHDWRIVIHGPLSGRTYQRQGAENWVLIEQNEGFA
jgi:hypothetical protein